MKSEVVKEKKTNWTRCYAGDETGCIAGYQSGEFAILKRVSIANASCVISEHGSEKASSWDLYKKKRFLGKYETLWEAKKAAIKLG